MVSKNPLVLMFCTVLKFEGEEGFCQVSLSCLGQYGQECPVHMVSTVPAVGRQSAFEGIMK